MFSFSQMLFRTPYFSKKIIEPIQIRPKSNYSNGNKPVLKIPLVLTLNGLIGNPAKPSFFINQK